MHRSRSEGLPYSSLVEASRENKEEYTKQTRVEVVEEVLQLHAEEDITEVTERTEMQPKQ